MNHLIVAIVSNMDVKNLQMESLFSLILFQNQRLYKFKYQFVKVLEYKVHNKLSIRAHSMIAMLLYFSTD